MRKGIVISLGLIFILLLTALTAFLGSLGDKNINNYSHNILTNEGIKDLSMELAESGPAALKITMSHIIPEGAKIYSMPSCKEENLIFELPGGTRAMIVKEWDVIGLIVTENGMSGFVQLENIRPMEGIPNPIGNPLFTKGYPIPIYRIWSSEGLPLYTEPDMASDIVKISGEEIILRENQVVYGIGLYGELRMVYYPAKDQLGWVNEHYLMPVINPLLSDLGMVETDNYMTYEMLETFIKRMENNTEFMQYLRVESIGKTYMGNDVKCLILGSPFAKKRVLITAGVDGNEHLMSLLLIKQLEMVLKYYNAGSYKGTPWHEIFEETAVYIVPMVNPDGVMINQLGVENLPDEELKNKLIEMNLTSSDFSMWSANSAGVDIDMNFDVFWNDADTNVYNASPSGYRGDLPDSEPETRGLSALVTSGKMDTVITIGTSGSVINWFTEDSDMNYESLVLALMLKDLTGYKEAGKDITTAPGSLYGWSASIKSIPAVSIEVGAIKPRMPLDQFSMLWQRNKLILLAAAWSLGNFDTIDDKVVFEPTPTPSPEPETSPTPTPTATPKG